MPGNSPFRALPNCVLGARHSPSVSPACVYGSFAGIREGVRLGYVNAVASALSAPDLCPAEDPVLERDGRERPPGAAGPSTVSAIKALYGQMTVAAGAIDGGVVSCPGGQRVVSGGYSISGPGTVFLDEINRCRSSGRTYSAQSFRN